jgi:cytochrome c peroxidase
MHNGAFTSLAGAIRYHLDAAGSAPRYTPAGQHLAADLSGPLGPMAPVLARLDPLLATPVTLTDQQFNQLVAFVRDGLLDRRAMPENLRRLVPRSLPSGRPVLIFEFPAN